MKYVAICVALYDYQAQIDNQELSFSANNTLYILENDDPDWYKAQLKVPSSQDGGPIGIIPSNYVEKAKPIGSVKAIYDYQPRSIEEVAFTENEVLTLYEDDDPDWFVVEKSDGKIGLAPSNYVEQHEQGAASLEKPSPVAMTTHVGLAASNSVPESTTTHEPAAPTCDPRWAIALFAFKPEAIEETYLEEHEQVLITDYVTSTDWWTIEHKNGKAGVVPANYVKFQDEYEVDLRAQEEEKEKQRLEAGAAAKEKEIKETDQIERKRQQDMAELNRQRDLEGKEKARQAEVERRRRMQEEAKQREIDIKRQANFAATAIASPQMGGGSPRRSQIPAPPPPPPQPLQPSLPAYDQQPPPPTHADPNKPDPPKIRMWTDRTGAFKVEAQFLSCANGKIRLFKTNGVKIDVPTQKMCVEDLKYIEQETGIKQYEDKNDNVPLAQLSNTHNNQFTWFDYFKKANIPHNACVEYAGNFDANNLTERDLEHLTHSKMKLLGMSEKHVQHIQKFMETHQADNEGVGGMRPGESARPRMKVKKSVTFGAISYIHEDGDSGDEDDVQWQIEQDEILARQLQEQEQGSSSNNASLHRRGTGRPSPSHSAPRDVNSSVSTPQQFETMKPIPAAPSAPSPPPQRQREIQPLAALPVNNTSSLNILPTPAFEDDAWVPRAGSSPSVQPAVIAANAAWNPAAQRSNTLPANVQSPARQRPTPQLSQQSMVDPELLAKWGGSPALAAANSRPVPPPPPAVNSNFTPLQHSASAVSAMQPQTSFQPQNNSMSSLSTTLLHQGSTSTLSSLQPTMQAPVNNIFQQQQATGNSFTSPTVQQQQPQQQQQFLFNNNSSSSSLNQYMYNQPSPHIVSLQSVLPPALAPQLTASSFQSTASSFGSPQLQHQTPVAAGRNWVNATPDNPFGSGALNNPAATTMQHNYGIPQQNTGFVPQSFGNNNVTSQIDPNDKYSVFKAVNPLTPSVFNNQQQQQAQQQQQQQQQRSFYY